MIKLTKIIQVIEELAPPSLQESYDNAGLLIGDTNKEISKALITLDVTEAVVEEAIENGCQLIIAHHPVIFKGLKRITGRNEVERCIIKAIKADLAIYAVHTNLDNVIEGVNKQLGQKLGLTNMKILSPRPDTLLKLVVFCPLAHAEAVRQAIFAAGAGTIGDYDQCSFNSEGKGTFRAGDNTSPMVGEKGTMHTEPEVRIETVIPDYLSQQVIRAMLAAHPYEEVAYDLFAMKNTDPRVGSGMIGELSTETDIHQFLELIRTKLNCAHIRHNQPIGRKVKKVAICGGSGAFLIHDAHRAGADVMVTGDVKYHEFQEHTGQMTIVDAGHYETEQGTKELLFSYLTKKIPTFAVQISEKNINPVSFL